MADQTARIALNQPVNNYLPKIVDKIAVKFFNDLVLRSFCTKHNGSSSKAGTARVSDVQQ